MTKVSIILPTYNRADWVTEAIASAKTAATEVPEIVVVDDASTDRTPDLCRNLPGIRYVRLEHNVGLAAARNAGIRISSGRYLAFLDDDDRRLPGSLDAQLELLDSDRNLSFVYAPVIMGDSRTCAPTEETRPRRCITDDIFWQLLEGNFIYVPSVVARKDLVEEVGLFDLNVRGLEDWLMWIRLAEQYAVGATGEPVAVYRNPARSSGQMSSNVSTSATMAARAQAKGLRLPKARQASAARRRRVRRRYLEKLFWQLLGESVACFQEGHYFSAFKNYGTAVFLNPRTALHPHTIADLPSRFKMVLNDFH